MRPSLLDPLFAPVDTLPGAGPKVAALLTRLVATSPDEAARLVDLLFHVPSFALDRRARPKIAQAKIGEIATFEATVTVHRPAPPNRPRAPHKILCEDETGDVTLVFFHGVGKTMLQRYPVGTRLVVSGLLDQYDGTRQIVHPDHIAPSERAETIPDVEPVYRLTEGLHPGLLRRLIGQAVKRLPQMPEWQDAAFRERSRFAEFGQALRLLHLPSQPDDIGPASPARRRLAYDELLASQLALALVRAHLHRAPGRPTHGDRRITAAILDRLPFTPTGSQTRALAEITADMAAPQRMLRLLQGDVGSGKTLVALLAMATAVEAGRQAALMAPTEILARQHEERLSQFAQGTGLRIATLTGRDAAGARARLLRSLAAGEIDILVGTHAVFQEQVAFADLALAVVDEQHRFGVHQRLALQAKGNGVDVLVMTATPIPRTLLLAGFGDMDVSSLTEKPAGRQPIETRVVPAERMQEVVEGLRRAIAAGAQAYWICPLIEESEALDVAAATERFAGLKTLFGAEADLLHGRMRPLEKDAAMARFAAGETKLLVATTVVEVGVDVRQATIMVIEHAERFGLAQLHQLRGRIGRGTERSSCILLYKGPLSETAKGRLAIMRETEDGFRIAEEDLRLRGPGEVLGTRQSGMADFRIADAALDGDLLESARADARLVLATDPELASPRGDALRVLLYLFERDAAVRLIRAG
ncbi:ATP-dependent DNA helicase RecG [Rhizobiales bacterium GAS191]|nr:ATP-dependent DNA helicase RecG [Rhizobiales bacterium GAS191]